MSKVRVHGAGPGMSVAYLKGPLGYGRELMDSWEDIAAKIKRDQFDGYIGDYKTIKLTTGETVVMEVAGINTYTGVGNVQIGPHVDFISRDCLKGAKQFNAEANNNGTKTEPNPWRASKLFKDMNDETTGVFSTLPADLKPYIIQKRALLESRYSDAGPLRASTGWAWNDMGKLWLPTEVEVFGNTFWSDGDAGWAGGSGCNLQYPIFIGGFKHIIKGDGNNGNRCAWWEASPRRQFATDMCFVYSDGGATYVTAAYAYAYAPLCFRIG